MKKLFAVAITTAALTGAGCASNGVRTQSRSILVEPPSALPMLARGGGADMFLHDTSQGQTLLYIESADGRAMSILDVTDPAHIDAVAKVDISGQAPFYYVEAVNQVKALVRYRNSPGYAVLDFSSAKRPALSRNAALAQAARAEPLDDGALLLSGTDQAVPTGYQTTLPTESAARLPAEHATQHYAVLDTSRSGTPTLIADVHGVKRTVAKADTGTTFLLADEGLTVIRNLRTEEAYAIHQAVERQ